MNSDDLTPDISTTQVDQQPHSAKGPGAWNTKKFRDEYDLYRARLQDQKFSVADYPDPLSPRPPHLKQYPKGTDQGLERKLHALISEAKAAGAGRGVGA